MKKQSYFLYSTIIFGLGGCLFVIFSMIIEIAIGSPSSTSALAILAIIPVGIIGGIIGIGFGVLYTILGRFIKSNIFHLSTLKFNIIVGVLVLLTSFCASISIQIKWNINNAPRVILDKKKISDKSLLEIEQKVAVFKNSNEEEKERRTFYKCNSKYEISYDSHSLTIKYLDLKKELNYNFKGHDYIRDIKYLTFINALDNEEYLLVYKKLRSTSRNIIYSIYNSKGECVYQKLEKIGC